jgi:hypothetical protein
VAVCTISFLLSASDGNMKSRSDLPRRERVYVLDETKNRPVAVLDRHEWMR